jgi:hypothetical protein
MKVSKIVYASSALVLLTAVTQTANASQREEYLNRILKSRGVAQPTATHRMLVDAGKTPQQRNMCVEDISTIVKAPRSENANNAAKRLASLTASMQETLRKSSTSGLSSSSTSTSKTGSSKKLQQQDVEELQDFIMKLSMNQQAQDKEQEKKDDSRLSLSESESEEEEGEEEFTKTQTKASKKGKEKDRGQGAPQEKGEEEFTKTQTKASKKGKEKDRDQETPQEKGRYITEAQLEQYLRAAQNMKNELEKAQEEKEQLEEKLKRMKALKKEERKEKKRFHSGDRGRNQDEEARRKGRGFDEKDLGDIEEKVDERGGDRTEEGGGADSEGEQ